MIILKNITDEEHKEELKSMLCAHYKEIYGENWEAKTPLQKLKDKHSRSSYATNSDMSELFNEPLYGTVAFGIINEEDNETLGFALLDIIKSTKANMDVETYGQLYQLYIKPDCRGKFLEGIKNQKNPFMESLKTYLDNYFKENGVTEIITAIPEEIDYLIECGKALGFEKSNEKLKETGIPQTLWSKQI